MYIKILSIIALIIATISNTACVPVVAVAVAGGGVAASSASSGIPVKKQVDDKWIKLQINQILLNIPKAQAHETNLSASVFNGTVLMLGQAPTAQLKTDLISQISQLQGVEMVYDQITVEPKQSVKSFVNDAWITSKVKANMVGRINPFSVKVVTESSIVYLLGKVTQEEAQQAANIAARTMGVKKVVKVFIYAPVKQASTSQPTAPQDNTTAPSTSASESKHEAEQNAYLGNYQAGSTASD